MATATSKLILDDCSDIDFIILGDGEFTSQELSESVLPHPTISEVIKEAAKNIMKQ